MSEICVQCGAPIENCVRKMNIVLESKPRNRFVPFRKRNDLDGAENQFRELNGGSRGDKFVETRIE